jgi:hypothetical protein
MQIFKKNTMPNLTMFKKVSIPKHMGKKMSHSSSSMNASAMPEKDSDDKKYHLEKKM